jgi:hypothetical protein
VKYATVGSALGNADNMIVGGIVLVTKDGSGDGGGTEEPALGLEVSAAEGEALAMSVGARVRIR